ncbi:hypothetical protein Nmel_017644, partial [Mimus melanotis]
MPLPSLVSLGNTLHIPSLLCSVPGAPRAGLRAVPGPRAVPSPRGSPECYGVVEAAAGLDAGHGSLRGKACPHEGPGVEHAQQPVDDHLQWGGQQWRVKPVVGEIASEDVQLTGNYPPWIPKFQIILWREKGFELPGKQDTHRDSWGCPVPQPRQSH